MASSYALRTPIRVGRRRITKLKFRRLTPKLLDLAEELRVGLEARQSDPAQSAIATVALASDLPVHIASALSSDDLAGALDGWTDALAAYRVEGVHE